MFLQDMASKKYNNTSSPSRLPSPDSPGVRRTDVERAPMSESATCPHVSSVTRPFHPIPSVARRPADSTLAVETACFIVAQQRRTRFCD